VGHDGISEDNEGRRGRMTAARVPKIHAGEFEDLNRTYYSAEPGQYFRNRLYSLLAYVADGDETAKQLKAGVKFLDLSLSVGSGDEMSASEKLKYASAESVVLLHHACEALIRLYLAHSKRNHCPWVAMSALTNFAEFKREAAKLRGHCSDPDRLPDLLEVVSLSDTGKGLENLSHEAWESHKLGLPMVFEFAVREFLDNSNLYNAAKHGFGLIAHEAGMSLDFSPELSMKKDGPALTYLERAMKDGKQTWSKSVQWVSPTWLLAWVGTIADQIDNLWDSAKVHYAIPAHDGEVRRLRYVDHARIDELLKMEMKPGFNVTKMSETLHSGT
jgi:hypothetical protein